MKRGGIFGPTEYGKTTLGISISRRYHQTHKIRSLVLDPFLQEWGPQAWVTNDELEFWRVVRYKRGCLVIVDDASKTIGADKALNWVFTTMRHNEHRLLALGHDGADLTRTMRNQLDTVYLFLCEQLAIDRYWRTSFPGYSLEQWKQVTLLQKFEFVRFKRGEKPEKMRLQL